ncbi:hypothetical protein WJX74_001055 [Apatococcus lobatus]|uniref:Complex 1 LYR protein domain-containing protein n=1 Tax=Apatococcus lobatus TaxID=904363 RepID=A0AAW1RGJ9_9CHLO
MPGTAEVRSLYRAFLRESVKFPNYNIREYVKRRATTGFRQHATEKDTAVLDSLRQQAQADLEVVKRQAIVYHLYSRKQKSVMDIPLATMLEEQAAAAPYSQSSS